MTSLFAIIGAGQAGAWVARTLRAEGFSGRIVMVGAESHRPYERPPLSKDVLSGKASIETAALLVNADELAVEHWGGVTAQSLDAAKREVQLDDGRMLRYDHLFLTTGAHVRRIAAAANVAGSDRLHVLRTADDALRLREALLQSRSLAVVGGGWIGLEVAATARQMGLTVEVIEAGERLCARSVPTAVSEYLRALHEGHGVSVNTRAAVQEIRDLGAQLEIVLGNGVLAADQVVVGVGVVPATELAEDAGLLVENGIVVDDRGRTSDPAISAAGDATNQPCGFTNQRVRLESWHNAQNQAIVAAKAALGQDVRHAMVPWVWSDQYDANIQILGAPELSTSLMLRGNPLAGSGCWLAQDNAGIVIGAIAVNAPKELRVVRKALEARARLDLEDWQDELLAANRIRAII